MPPIHALGNRSTEHTGLPSLYTSHTKGWTVEKVEHSDTATAILFFVKARPYSTLHISTDTYLSDEQGKTYPLRRAEGLVPGKTTYLPKRGETEIKLFFAPMPKSTKIFDLIEGKEEGAKRWYGLHHKRSKVRIPAAGKGHEPEGMGESMFSKGTATVQGKVEGYAPGWGYGWMAVDGHASGTGKNGYKSTLIRPDGTFSLSWDIDCPVWDKLHLGCGREIPIYVRPGDTLSLNIKADGRDIEAVEYVSTHPKGCYEKLLKCKMPEVYAEWESMGEAWKTLSDKDFFSMTAETMEKGEKLGDYFAWKYGLSAWEAHLLKSQQCMAVAINQTVLANWMLDYRNGSFPPNPEWWTEFYENNDYSLYHAVTGYIPQDDPSMTVVPYFNAFISRLPDMKPLSDAWALAHRANLDLTNAQIVLLEDSLQIEALRQIFGFKDTLPYLAQAFLADKMARLPAFLSDEERQTVIENRITRLTYPHLKQEISDWASMPLPPQSESMLLEDKVRDILQPIVGKYEGKYVQIAWISPGRNSRDRVYKHLQNLLADFRDHPDLHFVFLFDANSCTKEEYAQFVEEVLPGEDCHWLDFEQGSIMRESFRIHGGWQDITLGRKGEILPSALYTSNETQFRRSLRTMLETENDQTAFPLASSLDE